MLNSISLQPILLNEFGKKLKPHEELTILTFKKEFNSTVVSKSTNTQVRDKKIDNKNIVGKDNMYNRLVKAFGSKNVPKPSTTEEGYVEFSIFLPNKDLISVIYNKEWEMTYYPNENVYPNITDGIYFYYQFFCL